MAGESIQPSAPASVRAVLGWCGVLHVFTHLYNVILLPLYLPIQRDLGLTRVDQATGLMTAMMLGYVLPGYFIGLLADRWNRRLLLGWGLLVSALGLIGLSQARSFPVALAFVVLSGIGGSCYHPAANALIAQACPLNTGRAFGLVGIGASVGFFIGPLYAGWRAQHAGWRQPVLEAGLAGLAMAIIFLRWSSDPPPARRSPAAAARRLFPTAVALGWFVLTCLGFSLRDFGASAMASLSSLFLQQAHGFSIERTGVALSVIFLASAVSNPLVGHLSDRGQGRWITIVLLAAALVMIIFPFVPAAGAASALAVYGFFLLASFPITESALVVCVPDELRGRIFGLFLSIAGLIGNLGHWQAGVWVNHLGPDAHTASAYRPLFAGLALLVALAPLAMPALRRLQQQHQPRSPGPVTPQPAPIA